MYYVTNLTYFSLAILLFEMRLKNRLIFAINSLSHHSFFANNQCSSEAPPFAGFA